MGREKRSRRKRMRRKVRVRGRGRVGMERVVLQSVAVSCCLQEVLTMTLVTAMSMLVTTAVTVMMMTLMMKKMAMTCMQRANRLLKRRGPLKQPLEAKPAKGKV